MRKDGEGEMEDAVDGRWGSGGSSSLGGMFPARVGHNAHSVQAGPQELVLQQGRGSHQWPDDVNHPEPIHSDKQPPPSTPPPLLLLFSAFSHSLPPSLHTFCSVGPKPGQHRACNSTVAQWTGSEGTHAHTHRHTYSKFLTYIMGKHAYTHVHRRTQEQTLSVLILLMTLQASCWNMNWY